MAFSPVVLNEKAMSPLRQPGTSMYDWDVVKVTTYFWVSGEEKKTFAAREIEKNMSPLTCFYTFQRSESDSSLCLFIQILLLQEIHLSDAQTVGLAVVPLI